MKGFRRFVGPLVLLLLPSAACRREEAPPPPAPPQPAPLAPWTFHVIGGLLVIRGEVDAPTDLVLKGTTLDERRTVPFGPVRWELYRPPKGEVAELRDGQGRLLAHWAFDAPGGRHPEPVPVAARPKPKPPAPAPPKAAPPQPALPQPVTPRPAPPKPGPQPPPLRRPTAHPTQPPAAPPAPRPTVKPTPPPEARPAHRPLEAPRPKVAPQPEAPRPEVVPPARPTSAPATGPAAWPGAGEAFNLIRGPRGRRQVCLTFDGGSNAEVTDEVLDALRARGIRTTMFLTGAFIQRFPDHVRRMVADGHEVGNHTWSHPHFAPHGARDPQWTHARVQGELLAADAAFRRLTGRPMAPLWRAPYGEHTAEIRRWAEAVGYRHIYWSEGADTLDWATPQQRTLYRSGQAILKRLKARMAQPDGDGLIVLMHLGSERQAEDRPTNGLGAFLDEALRAGWTFVPVSAYLEAAGKPAWDPRQRLALLDAWTAEAQK